MYKLDFDFKSLSPYVIDAFSSVYGDEYRSIISDKINKAIIISCCDPVGLIRYVKYLKKCKIHEFSIRFLEEIGFNVCAYKRDNYVGDLDSNVQNILDHLISEHGFEKDANYWAPLLAFDDDNKINSEILLKNRIKILNFLLSKRQNVLDENNYEVFTTTEKYLKLLKVINEYSIVYKRILSEYREWEKQLEPLEKYAEKELNRKEEFLKKSRREFFRVIFDWLPLAVKDAISDKTLEKQVNIVVGTYDKFLKSNIEVFGHEQMEKLKSSDVDDFEKLSTMFQQSIYLEKLGVKTLGDKALFSYKKKESFAKYLSYLNQDCIRKYIPSDEVVNYISATREKMYSDAIREYYMTREDFINAEKILEGVNILSDNKKKDECIYRVLQVNMPCVTGCGGYNRNNDFCSIMFYTVRRGGYLFQTFMHECGHVIDQNSKGIGFELMNDNIEVNPYDNNYRKYEIFNETINDIFTKEAVNYLHNQGIYLIEPKNLTLSCDNGFDDSMFIEGLLDPLIEIYRPYVVRAKINSDSRELTKYIGEDNFEELVDTINKFAYLLKNGFSFKKDDDMIIEYNEQEERIIQIYNNIFNYYDNTFKNLAKKKFDGIVKKWKKIRDNLI